MSPGGSQISVPVLDCHDVCVGQGQSSQVASNTVSIYSQDFKNVSELTVTPVNVAPAGAGEHGTSINVASQGKTENFTQIPVSVNMIPVNVLPFASFNQNTNFSTTSNMEKGGQRKKKKSESVNDSGSGEKLSLNQTNPEKDDVLVELRPGEKYTATPITGNIISKAHVRSLNFGPLADNPQMGQFKKICPKPRNPPTPQVIIVHTNTVLPQAPSGVSVPAKTPQLREVLPKPVPQSDIVSPKSSSSVTKSGTNNDHKVKDEDLDSLSEAPATPRLTRQSARQQKLDADSENSCHSEISIKGTKTEDNNASNSSFKETPVKGKNRSSASKAPNDSGTDTPHKVKNKPCTSKSKNDSKTSKAKGKKTGEKLKVKIQVADKPKNDKKAGQRNPLFTLKKEEKNVVTDDSNSADDLPLSQLKGKIEKLPAEMEENDVSDTSSSTVGENTLLTTPKKLITEIASVIPNPSQEEMLEKVGLTPTKSLLEFKTPVKIQNDPIPNQLSSSKRNTPLTRGRLRSLEKDATSPVTEQVRRNTPRKVTPAKKLFSSPTKHCSKSTENKGKPEHVAKQVDKIIERLHKNNPENALAKTMDEKNVKEENKQENQASIKEQKGNERKDKNSKADNIQEKKMSRSKKPKVTKLSDKPKDAQSEVAKVSIEKVVEVKDTEKESKLLEDKKLNQTDLFDENNEEAAKIERDQIELETSVNYLVDLLNDDHEMLGSHETSDVNVSFEEHPVSDGAEQLETNCDIITKSETNGPIEDENLNKKEALVETVLNDENSKIPNTDSIVECKNETELTHNSTEGEFTKVKKHKKKHKHRHDKHGSEEGDQHIHRHKSKHKKHRHRENTDEVTIESVSPYKHKHKHRHRHRDSSRSNEDGSKLGDVNISSEYALKQGDTNISEHRHKHKHRHRHRDANTDSEHWQQQGDSTSSKKHRHKHRHRHGESHRKRHAEKRQREEETPDDNEVSKFVSYCKL